MNADSIPIGLAMQGYSVWGIDLSQEMLNQFAEKKRHLPESVREQIHLMHGDMTDFDLGKKFSLILIPFRGFQSLTQADQVHSGLQAVHRHLDRDGLFVVDVFRPNGQLDQSWVQPEKLDWETVDPRTGFKVRRTNIARKIDTVNQIIYPQLKYYVTNLEGTEEVFTEDLALRYYYEEQMRNLLLASGFAIAAEMGYYDRRPIEEGPELIFICKRKND